MKYLFLALLMATGAQAQQLYTSPCVQSGDYVKCLPTGGLFLNEQRGLFLGPDTNDAHYVELKADPTMAVNYTLTMPPTVAADGQSLEYVAGSLVWYTPFTQNSFETYEQAIPIKNSAQAAATGNINMAAGNPGVVDGVDFTFGGTVLLPHQTDTTQNGLWRVGLDGVWQRDTTMPDNQLSALSAIVAVNDGGTVNGNTIWYSQANSDTHVPMVQIPSYYNTDDTTLAAVVFKGNGTGAANSSAIAVRVTRIGRQVTLYIPTVTDAATGTTSTHLDSQTNLPTFARPSATVACYTGARNNGALVANSVSEVDVLSTGQIQVQRDTTGAAYTNSANAGFTQLSCSYPIF